MIKTVLKIVSALWLMLVTPAQAVVNMAVIAPMAGELKPFGEELARGVRIAVNDINDAGGIKGERINLIVVDDRCDDKFAVSTAQMMAVNSSARDKMNLVIGPYCDNAFDKVAEIYAQADIFQIIPTSVSRVNAVKNHRGLLKMVGSADRQGADFYQYYQNNFKGQKVALVYDGSIRKVVEIAAAVQNEFRRNGEDNLLATYNTSGEGREAAQTAQNVASQGNHLAYILGEAVNIARIARELKDEDRNIVLFTNRYQARDNYQEMLGDLAEGSYSIALPSLKDNPDFTETLVRLRLKGEEPQGLGVYGYSAVKLWEELVRQSGSFKYRDLAGNMNGRQFDMAWGEQKFNNGNPEKSVNYGIFQWRGGEYTQVY